MAEVDPREQRIAQLEAEIKAGQNGDQRVAFCHSYLEEGYNGAKAARKAGYSHAAAKEQASRLLTKANIKELIGLLAEQRFVEADVSTVRTLREIGRLAFFDIRNYFDQDGRLKRPEELTEDEAAAIVGIEETINGYEGKGEDRRALVSVKYKMASKDANLALLAKYHKLLSDLTIDLNIDLMGAVNRGRERARKGKAK